MKQHWPKRYSAILLAAAMILSTCLPAAAQDEPIPDDSELFDVSGDVTEIMDDVDSTPEITDTDELYEIAEESGDEEITEELLPDLEAALDSSETDEFDGLIEDPEESKDSCQMKAQEDGDEYFLATWDVIHLEYTEGMVLSGPEGAAEYRWHDLLDAICVTTDEDDDIVGLGSVSDDPTIIPGASSSTFTPVLDPDEEMHYYGCETDTGESVIYEICRPQDFIEGVKVIDSEIMEYDDVTLNPQIHYSEDNQDQGSLFTAYILMVSEPGIYEIESHDRHTSDADEGYTDPIAYLNGDGGKLIGCYDDGGDGENFKFTCELEAGILYILLLGYYDFEHTEYYCGAYGTYPVTISRKEENIHFSEYFEGTWSVSGLVYGSGLHLKAPKISTDYQWYDLGNEITTLYDNGVEVGYTSVWDDPVAVYGEKSYWYEIPWNNSDMIHYYACDTTDGTRMIYQVINPSISSNLAAYTTITLTKTCNIDRKSLYLAPNGTNVRFQLKPKVSGKCTITSFGPDSTDPDIHYSDPYVIIQNASGARIASNDDGGTGFNFKTTFNVTAGATYYVKACYADTSYELYGSYPFRISFTATAPVEKITISKKPSSVKAKASSKGKVTVSWKAFKKTKKTKAIWKKIKKIQVQYSTDRSFRTGVVTKTIGKSKKKLVVKGLKAKTIYWFRVRYSDNTGGYSAWSSIKKVKVK